MAKDRQTSSASSAKKSEVKKPAAKSNGKPSSNGSAAKSNGSSGNGASNGDEMMLPPPPAPSLANGMMQSTASPNKELVQKLLGVRTRNYRGPLNRFGGDRVLDSSHPIFMRYYTGAMLRDPDIKYGIEMLRGPIISKAKFKVVSSDPEVAEFVDRQIKRFWTVGAPMSLACLKYGYIGLETVYRWNEEHNFMEFDKFKFLHPNDTRPVIREGALVGMIVKRIRKYFPGYGAEFNSVRGEVDFDVRQAGVFLAVPKMFWTVNDRETHRWYGASRLEGAFLPWYETWQPQGYRGIRHGWFYKNCYDAGMIKYPRGATPDENGVPIPNVQIAQEILDRRETGAGIAIENSILETGGWEWTPPASSPAPDGLFDYGEALRDEKWEGIGVPPEVAKAEQTGSFAGRRVPQQAFYSFLQEIANYQMYDFDEQNLRYITKLNYGPEATYEIEPIPILVTLQQEEMGGITGHLPGDENDDFYSGGQNGAGGSGMQQSGGRVEDRDSNGFNMAEKKFTANANK